MIGEIDCWERGKKTAFFLAKEASQLILRQQTKQWETSALPGLPVFLSPVPQVGHHEARL